MLGQSTGSQVELQDSSGNTISGDAFIHSRYFTEAAFCFDQGAVCSFECN
jgi:hypothetical protein